MLKKELARQRERNPFLRLGEWVYQQLHDEITTLNLLPGTKLSESKLATDLNISRSPVKYAIERLTEERLLIKQGKAAVVSVVDKIECGSLCEARLGIECHATFLATKRISRNELKRLGKLAREYTHIASGPNVESCVDCDQEFHGIIIAASRNSCIQDMYDTISSRLLRYRRYTHLGISNNEAYRQVSMRAALCHTATYRAMCMGFADIASSEIRQDIEGMFAVFSAWDKEYPGECHRK